MTDPIKLKRDKAIALRDQQRRKSDTSRAMLATLEELRVWMVSPAKDKATFAHFEKRITDTIAAARAAGIGEE